MLERTFFRGHSISKMLGVDHIIEGGQIVDHSIRKITKHNKNQLKHGVYLLF